MVLYLFCIYSFCTRVHSKEHVTTSRWHLVWFDLDANCILNSRLNSVFVLGDFRVLAQQCSLQNISRCRHVRFILNIDSERAFNFVQDSEKAKQIACQTEEKISRPENFSTAVSRVGACWPVRLTRLACAHTVSRNLESYCIV